MPAVKKHLHSPANDLHPRASQPMSFVALPRPYWSRGRIVAAATACVVAVLGVVILLNAPQRTVSPVPPVAVAAVPKPVAATDIKLDTVPPLREQAQEIVETQPQPIPVEKQENAPSTFDVSVEEESSDVAAQEAALAQKAQSKNDIEQALRAQHRAAELAPHNIMYRLQLATLYDRAGKKDGALQLYKQVLAAYDNDGSNLPPSVDVDGIRHRAAYLASE